MLVAREEFGLVCDPEGKYLYAIGGFNAEDQCLQSVERYSFATDKWQMVTELDRPLKAMGAVALPDGIYVIGGFDGLEERYCAEVRRYDYSENEWHLAASMHVERGAFTAVALSTCDYIYAIGGFG